MSKQELWQLVSANPLQALICALGLYLLIGIGLIIKDYREDLAWNRGKGYVCLGFFEWIFEYPVYMASRLFLWFPFVLLETLLSRCFKTMNWL